MKATPPATDRTSFPVASPPPKGSVTKSFSAPDPSYLVWLAFQLWSTETSPSRRYELFHQIKHLSSIAGLGSFQDLFFAYVRPERCCPTIAATTIQATLRGYLCRRTPLPATTLGGYNVAINTGLNPPEGRPFPAPTTRPTGRNADTTRPAANLGRQAAVPSPIESSNQFSNLRDAET